MSMMSKEALVHYLQCGGAEMESLFKRARETRSAASGDAIFLYGFVYFSTWCRNNCTFCYFRRDNAIDRYRKPAEEVVAVAEQLARSGVNLIDLTMGEDEAYFAENFHTLEEIVREIKARTGLPVMVSPGVLSDDEVARLHDAGADWYALYQETHNRELFARLRAGQDYDARMHGKLHARDHGMHIEEGIMSGVGESWEDLADSLLTMSAMGASQLRVMSFVPQPGSPMEHGTTPDRDLERKIIALLRIMNPEVLIPASLDVDGIEGLRSRIDAGANVVTSIIPPHSGLVGVAQSKKDVDEGGRTVSEVSEILGGMGLRAADAWEYGEYLQKLQIGRRCAV